ncbi:sulfite exporter TauE/SafE family protein [Ornithinimicrobium cerasi]|uniref:sulfite exporter TauE/SafE family protein n=1 Tax=Ornithinimicrobium cerasi TaxID=2248773 RepID=UPI000F0069A1|nr:sulfite exporter TauE/SafE family protein [Ornithinimicrobium cerasi]
MTHLLLIALAGFGAQLVDGSLGMGYGVTSASLLLATGLAPALASASVNLAQLGTTLSSGASHWRAGNVDWAIVRRLALPGGIGGLLGATLLSSLSTDAARPVMAVLLLLLGVAVVLRFLTRPPLAGVRERPWTRSRRFLGPLGLVGGFVNATGGGGWGPVVTSTLLSTGPTTPRRVIGSVSASEFVVTVCASVGFLLGLGLSGLHLGTIVALMAGGVLAAPVAATLAGRLPAQVLGVAVGSMILNLNLGPVLDVLGVPGTPSTVARAVVLTATVLLVVGVAARRVLRRGREAEASRPGDPVGVAAP